MRIASREQVAMRVQTKTRKALLSAATAAGKIIKKRFRSRRIDRTRKSAIGDYVTNVDLEAERKIRQILRAAFPEALLIGEEGGAQEAKAATTTTADRREAIYIDPLDGTLNFIHGFDLFAVSIGYWKNGEPIAGVVYNPVAGELFYAARGQGAFRNGVPIEASKNRSLGDSLIATGWPYNKQESAVLLRYAGRFLQKAQEVRAIGCASLALCYVAAGFFDGYWEWDLYPWDLAAGVVIALEAGCRITDLRGEGFRLESGAVVSSNGLIHDEILEGLKEQGETHNNDKNG